MLEDNAGRRICERSFLLIYVHMLFVMNACRSVALPDRRVGRQGPLACGGGGARLPYRAGAPAGIPGEMGSPPEEVYIVQLLYDLDCMLTQ